MRVNVDKVLERDQKLSELDDRAGKLSTVGYHLPAQAEHTVITITASVNGGYVGYVTFTG